MMQITVTIPDDLAAQVQARGLTPEVYVEELIAKQAGSGERAEESTSSETNVEARLASLEVFLKKMASHSHKAPNLPDEAFTRESFYQDRD